MSATEYTVSDAVVGVAAGEPLSITRMPSGSPVTKISYKEGATEVPVSLSTLEVGDQFVKVGVDTTGKVVRVYYTITAAQYADRRRR